MSDHACHMTDEITRVHGESWSDRRAMETSPSATTFSKTVCSGPAFRSILCYYETSPYLSATCRQTTSSPFISSLYSLHLHCLDRFLNMGNFFVSSKCMHLLYAFCFGARWFTKEGWKIRRQNVQGMVCSLRIF
jgi:hypothetical protein